MISGGGGMVVVYDDHEICDRLVDKLQTRIEDLEHELRLARQHLDVCPTAVAIAEEDAAKRRADV